MILGEKKQQSSRDYAIILLVFALTGTTAAIFPRFLMPLTGLDGDTWQYYLVYFLLITPIYQVLLLGYAFVFGKFQYFYQVEKRMGQAILRLFGATPSGKDA